MDKTERTIAKVTNAGRILSRIAWIFDLIACGCSAFLILAALLWWNTRPDLFTGYASQTGALLICAGDLIGCAGSAVLAYFARQHFAHALEAQTPFTLRGAAEQKRLGILILCISPATMVLRVALSAAFSAEFMPERLAGMIVADGGMLALGVMFLVLSLRVPLRCRAGGNEAGIRQSKPPAWPEVLTWATNAAPRSESPAVRIFGFIPAPVQTGAHPHRCPAHPRRRRHRAVKSRRMARSTRWP